MAKDKSDNYSEALILGNTSPARIVYPPRLSAEQCKAQKINGRTTDANKNVAEITIAFPKNHPDFAKHREAVINLARKKFGANVKLALTDASDVIMPFKDGDAKGLEALVGHFFMKTRTQREPEYFDTRKRNSAGRMIRITDQAEIDKLFYSGCYVLAKVAYGYNDGTAMTQNKPTISAYLNAIVFVRDGERLGRDSASDFDGALQDDTSGEVSEYDPLAGDTAESNEPAF